MPKIKKVVFISFLALFSIGLLTLVYFKVSPIFVWNGVKYTRDFSGKITSAERLTPLGTQNKNTPPENDPVLKEVKYWEIIDTDQNPNFPTGLKLYNNSTYGFSVLRWKDFLIGYNLDYYPSDESSGGSFSSISEGGIKTEIRSVRVFNIKTGETFDIALTKPTWGDIWYQTHQIVGNSYYFGVGNGFGASLGYKLDLPPTRTSTITKLNQTIGNKLTKAGNFYIGSSCYEGCSYSLFNPQSQRSTELTRLSDARNERLFDREEEFVGFDKNGNVILKIKDVLENPLQNSDSQIFYPTKEIVSVPLNNEAITNSLVKNKDFPEKIYEVYMIEGQQKILMFGNTKAYFYNINTKKFTDVKNIPNNFSHAIGQDLVLFNSICFGQEPNSFKIDFEKETYSRDVSNCKPAEQPDEVQKYFNDLKLPDNFKLSPVVVNYLEVSSQ